ncbi:MAG: outer membrane protein transport protein, partial [Hyphomicrobium sp.]
TDVETESAWAGRFHLLSSRMVSMGMTTAVSYQVTPGIAVSAGVQVDYFETRFENIVLLPIPGAAPVESVSFMKGTDWGFGGVLGVVLKPLEGTSIGLSYHSKVEHKIDGFAAAHFPGFPSELTRYQVDLPQYVTAGLEQRISSRLRLFAEVQWVDWSTFDGFDISFVSGRPNEIRPVAWKDTWMVAGGFAYEVQPGTEISAGVHYDTAASEGGSGVTLSADANKLMAGAGISQDVEGLGRVTLSYAHIFAEDAPVVARNASSGILEGTLDAHVDMIGIGVKKVW